MRLVVARRDDAARRSTAGAAHVSQKGPSPNLLGATTLRHHRQPVCFPGGPNKCLCRSRSGFVNPLCNRKNHHRIYPPDTEVCLYGQRLTPQDPPKPLKHVSSYLFHTGTKITISASERRSESGFVNLLALRAGPASWPARLQAAKSTQCVVCG